MEQRRGGELLAKLFLLVAFHHTRERMDDLLMRAGFPQRAQNLHVILPELGGYHNFSNFLGGDRFRKYGTSLQQTRGEQFQLGSHAFLAYAAIVRIAGIAPAYTQVMEGRVMG